MSTNEINKLKWRCSEMEIKVNNMEEIFMELGQHLDRLKYKSIQCGECGNDPRHIEFGGCGNNECPHGLG